RARALGGIATWCPSLGRALPGAQLRRRRHPACRRALPCLLERNVVLEVGEAGIAAAGHGRLGFALTLRGATAISAAAPVALRRAPGSGPSAAALLARSATTLAAPAEHLHFVGDDLGEE